MSANIDTMMYVGTVPWHGLGHQYEVAPTTSKEIIEAAELGWTVNSAKMHTDLHGDVFGYHAIYREDNNHIIGVVNKARPKLVQNVDTFNAFEDIIGNTVTVDTAASLGGGEKVFGCFKISNAYKLVDDEVDHYFVVLNEHLKADGKITILNTPIRVVCQNTLSQALSQNSMKIRIPLSSDNGVNAELAKRVIGSVDKCVEDLSKTADKLVTQKVSKNYVETILDELFPYLKSEGNESLHTKANEAMDMMRSTFLSECMAADNLANYRGTQYQIFNALTDFSQHYFKNVDKGYDLNYRMNMLPGVGTGADSPASLVTKFLRIKDKIVA